MTRPRRTGLTPSSCASIVALALALMPWSSLTWAQSETERGVVAGAKPKQQNRLAKETSPYLLLHAHNPVDWYPWGPEAFAKAKAEDKPIFLSVGYSACYWCHVMERECFKDPSDRQDPQRAFVCIKVDREERPDIDQIYMAALQAFGNAAAGRCRCS